MYRVGCGHGGNRLCLCAIIVFIADLAGYVSIHAESGFLCDHLWYILVSVCMLYVYNLVVIISALCMGSF